jgi:hypothetical protein
VLIRNSGDVGERTEMGKRMRNNMVDVENEEGEGEWTI